MPIFTLDKELVFPPAQLAEPDGLLAIGGDLSLERLLVAYRSGIFPWYEGDHILWWTPDPRFVLFPHELRISKSMQVLFRKDAFEFTVDKAFEQVISSCKKITRRDQGGTWITDEVREAYINLHKNGYAQSVEVWQNGILAGGLYGVRLGKVFFGESMFSNVSNASKYAFIRYVNILSKQGVVLIDCQVYTEHLESLGAKMISRVDFVQLLEKYA